MIKVFTPESNTTSNQPYITHLINDRRITTIVTDTDSLKNSHQGNGHETLIFAPRQMGSTVNVPDDSPPASQHSQSGRNTTISRIGGTTRTPYATVIRTPLTNIILSLTMTTPSQHHPRTPAPPHRGRETDVGFEV